MLPNIVPSTVADLSTGSNDSQRPNGHRSLTYSRHFLLIVLWILITIHPAAATSFNLTFDASTVGAPAGFFTAITNVVQYYQATFTDPITINLVVGWGQIDGVSLQPGFIGESLTNQTAVPYSTLLSAFQNDAKSSDDATAVASLPASNPTATNFVMSRAEGKALGLLPANATTVDGWIGFSSSAPYTFDQNNRAVTGEYDFIGLAAHEITEVMGRYGFGQNGGSGADSPIDLFRYSSPGTRDLAPAFGGSTNYFSINGGTTVINTFNTSCCGDLSDWSGQTADAYNAFLSLGQVLPVSTGDTREMDVLGYDLSTVPEPSTLVLVSVGLIGCLFFKRRLLSGVYRTAAGIDRRY
jgi:hypothetical protein